MNRAAHPFENDGFSRRSLVYRWGLLAVTLGTFFPVWRWYLKRLTDGGDEPLGVVALVFGLAFVIARGWPATLGWWRFVGSSFCLAISAVDFLPPLVRGILAVSAVAFLALHGRSWLAIYSLLVLSLPLVSSMQFYLGYPLRLAIGFFCQWMLQALGYAVEARGAVLEWRGELVIIDAPCSGVQMIWTVAMFSAGLASWSKLNWVQYLRLARWTGTCVFVGNALRNVLLFLFESGIWFGPAWVHDFVGILIFVVVLWVVYAKNNKLKEDAFTTCDSVKASSPRVELWGFGGIQLIVCALVLIVQFASSSPEQTSSKLEENRPWPIVDSEWQEIPLSEFEEKYAGSFPGRIASFYNEDRSVILREVERPTRMLHSATDCYRGIGYSVSPLPIVKQLDGTFWSRAEAIRGKESLVLIERIFNDDGQSWTDISSWYWSAVLGRSKGPWFSVTEIVNKS